MKEITLTIFEIIDILREIHLENRGQFDFRNELPPAQWAEQHCTVHLNLGRRTEKTRYILNRARKDDCIVAFNSHWANIGFKGAETVVLTPDKIKAAKPNDLKHYKTIYIDEPELVFKTIGKQELYKKLSSSIIDQTFILLGA